LTVISPANYLTLSANNSAYTGTITQSGAGAVRLSSLNAVSPGTAYMLNGSVTANATGIFNLGSLAGSAGSIFGAAGQNYSIGALNANTDFGGAINGATMIIKTGTGTQTLSGANTYTGSTVVSNGVLQIGNGGTSGVLGSGNVTDNATLAFNRSDAIDDTGFGVISGTGNLAKRGTGRLALTKAQTYTGATTVEGGTLALTNLGSIASSSGIAISSGALFDVSGATDGTMTLASGKTLSGSGSVKGGFTIGSGAMLAPGNSIGTLTFSNALTLATDCTNIFEISTSPATNDVARIFGALTNGGTLVVTNIGVTALAAGDSFKLFNAASYSGSFNALVLPPLTNTLTWDTSTMNTNGTLKVIAAAPPVVNSYALLGDGNFRLNFSGTANQAYEIRASTNLTLTPITSWTLLGSGVFGGSAVVFDDLQATNFGQRFYLIHIP
jgi:fibronectin-binding autotransporter adhesin